MPVTCATQRGLIQALGRMKSHLQSAALLLALLPGTAVAEVSDKVASISTLWLTAVMTGVVVLLAGRYRFFLGVALLPVSIFLICVAFEPILDPDVGPAVVLEQGSGYISAVYRSSLVLLACHIIGLWLGLRHRRAAA